jgi:hypothetical protein
MKVKAPIVPGAPRPLANVDVGGGPMPKATTSSPSQPSVQAALAGQVASPARGPVSLEVPVADPGSSARSLGNRQADVSLGWVDSGRSEPAQLFPKDRITQNEIAFQLQDFHGRIDRWNADTVRVELPEGKALYASSPQGALRLLQGDMQEPFGPVTDPGRVAGYTQHLRARGVLDSDDRLLP